MNNTLILGARAPVALDLARSFSAAGHRVYAADSISCRLNGWSRHVTQFFSLPSPRRQFPAFVAALKRVINKHQIDLIVPTCEEVFYLSRAKPLLPTSVHVFCDEFDKLRGVHSKWDFLRIAGACGIPVPDSLSVFNLNEAREWSQQRSVILKPEFSRFGVDVKRFAGGVPSDAKPLPQRGRWVAQRMLTGQEYCSYSVAVDGHLTAHVCYRPLYRLPLSSSFYFDPIVQTDIAEHVERFVRHTRFHGQISFDWIEDEAGIAHAIECNPRAISGLHLFNRDSSLAKAMCSSMRHIISADTKQAKMLAPAMLTAGCWSAWCNNSLAQWRYDFARASDVMLDVNDWKPAAGVLFDFVNYSATALWRRASLRAVTTADIEWDGEEIIP